MIAKYVFLVILNNGDTNKTVSPLDKFNEWHIDANEVKLLKEFCQIILRYCLNPTDKKTY